MELWVRSQDRKRLLKVDDIMFYERNGHYYIGCFEDNLASYKSKERALEVIDEIQKQIKPLLYLKPKTCLELKTIIDGKRYFEKINNINFITTDSNFEIKPITTNVIVYELPKE